MPSRTDVWTDKVICQVACIYSTTLLIKALILPIKWKVHWIIFRCGRCGNIFTTKMPSLHSVPHTPPPFWFDTETASPPRLADYNPLPHWQGADAEPALFLLTLQLWGGRRRLWSDHDIIVLRAEPTSSESFFFRGMIFWLPRLLWL